MSRALRDHPRVRARPTGEARTDQTRSTQAWPALYPPLMRVLKSAAGAMSVGLCGRHAADPGSRHPNTSDGLEPSGSEHRRPVSGEKQDRTHFVSHRKECIVKPWRNIRTPVAAYLAMTLIATLVVLASWLFTEWLPEPTLREKDYLTTLLQIVPATVISVFVFAAGTVFVVAQVIHSPLGSRGVEELLKSVRGRVVLTAGVFLLICSLLLAVSAPADESNGSNGYGGDPLPAEGVPPWASVLAIALAAAAVLYTGVAVYFMFSLSRGFIQPDEYAKRLAGSVSDSSLTTEDAYKRVRAIRQWLRTACGSGESRDIAFSLRALRNLVTRYALATETLESMLHKNVEGEPECKCHHPSVAGCPHRYPVLRRKTPVEYAETRDVVRTHWASMSWPGPSSEVGTTSRLSNGSKDSANSDELIGWFGDEIGRAAARSLETGIRSKALLVRDADRILGTMCWTILQLLKAQRPLLHEAGYLVDRIAEVGLFQALAEDPFYQEWCTKSSSSILVSLAEARIGDEGKFEIPPTHGSTADASPKYHTLCERAFAGWLLIRFHQDLVARRGASSPLVLTSEDSGVVENVDGSESNAKDAHVEKEAADSFETRMAAVFRQPVKDFKQDSVRRLAHIMIDDISWFHTSVARSGQNESRNPELEQFITGLFDRLSSSVGPTGK